MKRARAVASCCALVSALLVNSAHADEVRFHYEAAIELGVHTIGDEEAQMGEQNRMFALRILGAPGALVRVGDGETEVGGHGVIAGMIAGRGGGLSAGADVMVRRHLQADRALDARLAVVAAVVGDDGLAPWAIMPGVGMTMAGSRTLTIRLDGELSKKDIGEGYGVGAYTGVGFEGSSAAIASGVVAGLGLVFLGIAALALGA